MRWRVACALRYTSLDLARARRLVEGAWREAGELAGGARELAGRILGMLWWKTVYVAFATLVLPLLVLSGLALSLSMLPEEPRVEGVRGDLLLLALNGVLVPLVVGALVRVDRALRSILWLRRLAGGRSLEAVSAGEWRGIVRGLGGALGDVEFAFIPLYAALLGPYISAAIILYDGGMLSSLSLRGLILAYGLGLILSLFAFALPGVASIATYAFLLYKYNGLLVEAGAVGATPGLALVLLPVLASTVPAIVMVTEEPSSSREKEYAGLVRELASTLREWERRAERARRLEECLGRAERTCCVEGECHRLLQPALQSVEESCNGEPARGACIVGGLEGLLDPLQGFTSGDRPLACISCSLHAILKGRLCGKARALCETARIIAENWDYIAAGVREELEKAWHLARKGLDESYSRVQRLTGLLRDVERLAREAQTCGSGTHKDFGAMARELRVNLESHMETLDRLVALGKIARLLGEAETLRRKALERAEEWLASTGRAPG